MNHVNHFIFYFRITFLDVSNKTFHSNIDEVFNNKKRTNNNNVTIQCIKLD